MHKKQFYDMKASFLIPAYNLPDNVLSQYISTQHGQHAHGNITIDVWLVKALKDNPTKSMIESLRKEKNNYRINLEKELIADESVNNTAKSLKIRQLEKGKALFSELVAQAQDPVYHKQPDNEFLKTTQRDFACLCLSSCQPDLKNCLYLAGLSKCTER